jgi:hypothetical protein
MVFLVFGTLGQIGGVQGQVWRHSVMGGNCIPNDSIRGSLVFVRYYQLKMNSCPMTMYYLLIHLCRYYMQAPIIQIT